MSNNKAKKGWVRIIRCFFVTLGVFFLVMMILALTPLPYYMHYHLGKAGDKDRIATPDAIVMFGGAGMPSGSNLLRLYHTAEYARQYHLPVIIAHPEDSVCQTEMLRYLVQSGIDDSDIHFMTQGTNTRSQALGLEKTHPELLTKRLAVITSTEHIKRTVKCLNKVGFKHVIGIPAREATIDFDLSLREQELKGNSVIPSVESTKIRYNFWNYFKLEITCFREYAALAYYRIKGWI